MRGEGGPREGGGREGRARCVGGSHVSVERPQIVKEGKRGHWQGEPGGPEVGSTSSIELEASPHEYWASPRSTALGLGFLTQGFCAFGLRVGLFNPWICCTMRRCKHRSRAARRPWGLCRGSAAHKANGPQAHCTSTWASWAGPLIWRWLARLRAVGYVGSGWLRTHVQPIACVVVATSTSNHFPLVYL